MNKKFYSDLYSSSNINARSNNGADDILSNIPMPKLNNLKKNYAMKILKISEISKTLREFSNRKYYIQTYNCVFQIMDLSPSI